MLTRHPALEVVNLDALTYAGNPRNLEDVADDLRYRFVHGSIADREAIAEAADGVDAIVNFAAETHVDRSIHAGTEFVTTNVLGPMALLDWMREHGGRLVHVSTDEVYGDIEPGQASKEGDALRPSSPYSAAKAGGDLQVLASVRTYGADAMITRGSNTYGPYQYPEKMIPLFATNLLDGKPVPVYGDGRQARDFIWVEDHCAGIELVLHQGAAGEVYNVGGGHEIENVETTRRLLELTGRDETADPARRRSPGPRSPLRARLRQAARARLGSGDVVRRGARADGRVVPRAARLVGADQARRRVRGLQRATVRGPDMRMARCPS